jgi:pyruvate ferredoxin oxidoreductase alpha subunit
VPVMVCMDGFILTHAVERIDVPTQEQVDAFLPPFAPRQVLDPDAPVSIGAMVGPEAFTEVRYLAHAAHLAALERIPELAREFSRAFGREAGGLLRRYRTEDAETIVVALGSVLGTVKDTVDALRDEGARIGVVGIGAFRPFPSAAVREALIDARRVVVLDRAMTPAAGGPLAADVRLALAGAPVRIDGVVAGLGGRPVTTASLRNLLDEAVHDRLEALTFLDLDTDVVRRELAIPGGLAR